MSEKKFQGYYIVGATNLEAAKLGKGLMLWATKKPKCITQWFNKILLQIYWIDCERNGNERGKPLQENSDNTYINKDIPVKYQQHKSCKKDDCKCKK